MTIDDILNQLEAVADADSKGIVEVLKPFIPVIIREGESFMRQVIDCASCGDWTQIDKIAYVKMTEGERDELSSQILSDARNAVDREFARNARVRKILFQITTRLLIMAIL